MGFQKKSAKGRLDKYYHLAKEQGYRARSAYKLIQLNRDFNFLSGARCLIDLCAAPGGWLQVAQKYMPPSSVIVGVDLVPIKPIPNVITFAEDITTDKCRNKLSQTLKTWKADVVLHDGAPNVGSSWSHDAFTQSELVLKSFKLATEFLQGGGTFVTKIFRSKDYNSLIWVFNQFFKKVKATKPLSSRNVSAEIFVVCKDYIAPKNIDPRFLDPKYVFEELDVAKASTSLNIFAPESKQKKRHREGYEEGNYTLHTKVSAMELVKAKDPIVLLGSVNELTFDDDEAKELLLLPETTEDIIIYCKDIKLIGKKDFRTLMKWRAALRERYKLETSAKDEEEKSNAEEEEEEQNTEDEIEQLAKSEQQKLKKQRRRVNEKRQKQLVKMQLNMVTPKDIGMEQGGEGLFSTTNVGGKKSYDANEADRFVEEGSDDSLYELDSDNESGDNLDGDDEFGRLNELDRELNKQYDEFMDRLREKDSKTDIKKRRSEQEEFRGFSDGEKSDSDSSDEDEGPVDIQAYKRKKLDDDTDSDGSDNSDDDASAIRKMKTKAKQDKKARKLGYEVDDDGDEGKKQKPAVEISKLSKKAAMWFDQPIFEGLDDSSEDEVEERTNTKKSIKRKADAKLDDDSSEGELDDDDDDDFKLVPKVPEGKFDFGTDDEEVAAGPDTSLATAEAMTLAYKLANRQETRQSLEDQYFNRHSMNDIDGLPQWFLDDEQKHNKPNIPVTKEAMQLLRDKLKALNARPIKKIAEAKARKKMRASRRLASLTKKAEGIAQNEDMTESEKARSIEKMMNRGTKAKPKKKVQVVVAKGKNKGKGRPQGVKGRYKMVDKRLKKDLRAEKAQKKAQAKKRRH
ncbi:AdoMet-dependent rRNA methyltransferase spb1 [Mycoemilia scoparia]|uniref:AdoMet-dependent rRNA methyltransferase spb1 n=1 Tax=Mycoemilia scoparia TaxID=417184 RepID=A0A9W8A3U5_9FUNG|nr:AdoMet-dependent rRNA methyltransferase spb1 [Mycoemilia scoparia]